MRYLLVSIGFHVTASILLKFGALQLESFTFFSVLTNFFYLLALFFLFLQAGTWQYSLKRFKLSHAYMFTSLYYPIILLASYFIFREIITTGNIVGTIIIIAGLSFTKANSKKNV